MPTVGIQTVLPEAAGQRAKVEQEQLAAAKAAVEAAQQRALQATKECEAAQEALTELKASLRPGKQPRTESSTEPTGQTEEIEPDPENWETYSQQTFRSLFRKYQKSSTKAIDPDNQDKELPPRGERDGWRRRVASR